MKKITRIVALALVIALACLTLASCAKTLNGTYSAELDVALASVKVSYTFKGGNVTLTVTGSNFITGSATQEYDGKYEITEAEDGTMSITFEFEDSNDDTKKYGGTQRFSEDKDAGTIKIGAFTYKLQK